MITWQELQNEITEAQNTGIPDAIDVVRRKAYDDFVKISGRPLLVYATAFQNPMKAGNFGPLMSIDLTDKDGFTEITSSIKSKKVDVLIHSPGGSAEATESIVSILRSQFKDVRFIITGAAKSAATMLAMSGDEILITEAGELGPIDPQINLFGSFTPAGSLKEEFDKAAQEIMDNPDRLPVWLPILEKYPPALLTQCDNFIQLARDLVQQWLEDHMFESDPDKHKKSEKIAAYLANEKNTLSHARRIDHKTLKKMKVKYQLVEELPLEFQEALRKVHLSVTMTLEFTGAVKIFENSEKGALIRVVNLPI